MERFEGNGAECMVRFIEAGNKGTIRFCDNDIVRAEKLPASVWYDAEPCGHYLWLYQHCTYLPPEPVWRDAVFWDAYRSIHEGKGVRFRSNYTCGEEWHVVCIDNSCWRNPEHFVFQVQEE